MDTGTFNVLHDSRYQNICSITDGIYFNLFSHNVFIYQDGMLLRDLVDNAYKFINILIADGNLHSLAAQYIGGANQHRIAQCIGCLFCFLCRKYRMACRSWDLALLQDSIKALPVLCSIHILCGSSQDRDTHLHQGFCQLNSCLSSKLHDCPVRLFNVNNTLHILRSQRLKIQLVCNIKVGADGFRIVVDNDGFIALPAEGPCAVNRTEVKLNTLPNTDRAGAKHQHLLASAGLFCLVNASEAGIVVRCFCRKFSCTGIYHLIGSPDIIVIALLLDLLLGNPCKPCDHCIRIFKALCLSQKLCGKLCLLLSYCL